MSTLHDADHDAMFDSDFHVYSPRTSSMTDQHPITPPEELVQQWASESLATQHLCTQAARWGADQELEACCAEVSWFTADKLRAARRPKPMSLKEQALGAMGRFTNNAHMTADEMNRDFDTIRRALEQLND